MNILADYAALPPLILTTARWYNSGTAKVLAHTGPYTQFRYGTDTYGCHVAQGKPADGPGGFQVAIVCTAESGVFAIDVDKPEQWEGSATARHVSAAQAFTVRGDHFHILADARHLRAQFPVMGGTTWGDVKARGFVPLPGSWHYSGVPYQGTGYGLVRGSLDLIGAVMADRAAYHRPGSGGGGGGGPRTGPYDHDTARAGIVLRGLLEGLDTDAIRALWDAAPDHDEACSSSTGFTEKDWDRHWRGAFRKAGEILAKRDRDREWSAFMLAWRAGGAR